jgi:hypothetical protein|tara:strand:+ start:402 stop:704 length:303 start_codon:yes stop_codon:yes gene_type:complete
MKPFLTIFAYFCIWTTPFQVAIVIWGILIVATTDYGILSLTGIEFFTHYLQFFMVIIDWLYTWFWNPYLDFVIAIPIIFTTAIKAVFSTWLGFWILGRMK